MKHFFQSGITLVELIVVMGIIVTLSGAFMVIINPQGQRNKALDADRKSDIGAIQVALEQYRLDNSSYPISTQLATCGQPLTAIINGTSVTYLQKIPCDPQTTGAYPYDIDSTTGNYCLRACLSTATDKASDESVYGAGSNNLSNSCGSLAACGTGTYSYTVVPQ